jgi:hypothetical protein
MVRSVNANNIFVSLAVQAAIQPRGVKVFIHLETSLHGRHHQEEEQAEDRHYIVFLGQY